MTERAECTEVRWCDKQFPACCLHCYHYISEIGACGHAQRDVIVAFFARHPDASCPIYGRLDVNSPGDDPVVVAFQAGDHQMDPPTGGADETYPVGLR